MNEDRCIFCMEKIEEKSQTCPHCGKGIWQYRWQPGWYKPLTVLKEQYVLGVVLGQGAFGVIYLGWDKVECRKVAVKVFSSQGSQDAFERETEIFEHCGNISGLVQIWDSFEEEGNGFLIMEYLSGGTLKQYLAEKSGKIHYTEALDLLKPIFEALVQMHGEGIVHCDISADNIMLDENGQCRLIDLGAAQRAQDIREERILKEAYGAPEQYANPEKIGPWTDVYECCALLYEMIAGERILPAASRIRKDQLQNLSVFEKIPAALELGIMRGLELEIQKRYFSVAMLMQQLGIDTENVKVYGGAVRHFWGQLWISVSAQGKFAGNAGKRKISIRKIRKILTITGVLATCAVLVMAGYWGYYETHPYKYIEKKMSKARAYVKEHPDELSVCVLQDDYEEIIEFIKENGTPDKAYISDSECYKMSEKDVLKLGIPVNGKHKLYLDWKILYDAFLLYMDLEEKDIKDSERSFYGSYMRYTTNIQELYNSSFVDMKYHFEKEQPEGEEVLSETVVFQYDPLDKRGISVEFDSKEDRVIQFLTDFLPICCPETYLTEEEAKQAITQAREKEGYMSVGLNQKAWIRISITNYSEQESIRVTVAADDGGLI